MTVRQHLGWRMARAVWRFCSLRNVFALATGSVLALLPLISAGPASSSVALVPYVPDYPHRAHAYQLALTRLHTNAPAREWLAAADRALLGPETVTLPFAAKGELAAELSAAGYAFKVAAGRRLTVTVSSAVEADELFVDLFRVTGARHERVAGAVPRGALEPISLEVLDEGEYLLRVQPPLGATAPYEVELATRALLAFPVAGVDQRAIWSGFGAERDGGRRAHRGVDIFAARGTPALAATDGWVTRVETTRRGGNVVWMQPLFGNMRIYYAHLDEQWVAPGDFVVAGQPLGAVGNTGNAVTTPPHLHFGVYVRQPGFRGGARDPADFLR
jgi:murein DD-endopeptidase MepM/ murein hydrolase activator NlpD